MIGAAAGLAALLARSAPAGSDGPFADFVEPGFPFIGSTVDARGVGAGLPEDNVTPRAVVLMLGNDTYAAWDPDLLRMSIAWRGEFLSLTTMAQVSYRESGNKNNAIPRVLGRPIVATGLYPGWSTGEPAFADPRPPGPNPRDPGRGPLPVEQGRWGGVYVVGDRAVLSYEIGGTRVHEQPGSVRVGAEVALVRAFRVAARARPLALVVGEVDRGGRVLRSAAAAATLETASGDSVVRLAVAGARGARLEIRDGRYVIVRVPAGVSPMDFRVVAWRGPAVSAPLFPRLVRQRAEVARFRSGGPPHWPAVVETRGELAPDTAAYVVDRLTLPIPNPWRRNVRVADVGFFADGRAALVTFDGDVWLLEGLDADLRRLRWKRFASGLYEPLSLEVVDGRIHVYGREGIVRLHDLNADGEADFYENFTNLIVTSVESREYPLGMVARPGGGFFVAKGGALDNGPRTAPAVARGFRAGSRHAGTILEVSPDGRWVEPFATGLREPILGIHPRTGVVTASDQQGNFVPATPVFQVQRGGYYGVPPTAHRDPIPEPTEPLLWIPHAVDQSAAAQVWVPAGSMGFREDALIHLSYGRPGLFRILADTAPAGGQAAQAAAVSLLREMSDPLLRGAVDPRDGQLYVAGFQIWGSRAREVSALLRVRHTARPSTLPESVRAGREGLLLRFGVPLDSAAAADVTRYDLRRWNYRRTDQYGSGHFRLDGSAGQDSLAIAAAHLSADRRSLLLVVPDMRPAMQMQLGYALRSEAGQAATDTVYLTLHRMEPLPLAAVGLDRADLRPRRGSPAAAPATARPRASAAAGARVFQRSACAGCHSVDGSTEGKLGPSMKGLFGSSRKLADGSVRTADERYLRRAILEPAAEIAHGYSEGMPSFAGVLGDTEIESLVLYIRSLAARPIQ